MNYKQTALSFGVLFAGCGTFAVHVNSDEVRLDDLTKRLGQVESRMIDPKSLGEALKNHEDRLLVLEAAKPKVMPTPEAKK